MTEADINEVLDEWAHAPFLEVVQLTVTNDETYTSKKFDTVLGAIATSNSDDNSQATAIAVTISGAVVTLRNTDLSDSLVTLVLFGIK